MCAAKDAILLHAQKAPPQNMQCSCATAWKKEMEKKESKKREPRFPCFCPFFTLFQPCFGWFLPIQWVLDNSDYESGWLFFELSKISELARSKKSTSKTRERRGATVFVDTALPSGFGLGLGLRVTCLARTFPNYRVFPTYFFRIIEDSL